MRSSGIAAQCVLALVIAGPPCQAQNVAQVEGVVTNSVTGEPVLRAHVTLFRIGSEFRKFGALTSAEGKFSISGLSPGAYVATLEKTGFVSLDRAERIELHPGDRKDDIKLRLSPAGSISGRVVDAEGVPVQTVSVMIEGPGGQVGAPTDYKGQFRLGGLAPGKYRVKAQAENSHLPPEIRTDGSAEIHYATTYYPNSLTPGSASRIAVGVGSEVTDIEIRLVRMPIVRVSGRLMGLPDGSQRVRVGIVQGYQWVVSGEAKPDGSFELWRVDPGKYRVIATSLNDRAPLRSTRTAPVDIEVGPSHVDQIELQFIPPSDIQGRVEFEDETAKPRKFPHQEISLEALTIGASVKPAAFAEDGSFKLEQVSPDLYRIHVTWPGVYVKSVRLGATTMEGSKLDTRSGAAGDAVTVLVSAATSEVSGTVRDEKGPVANVPVRLAEERSDMLSVFQVKATAADGTYSFAGIPPGKYRLWVGTDEDAAENIEIGEKEKLTRDLKLR